MSMMTTATMTDTATAATQRRAGRRADDPPSGSIATARTLAFRAQGKRHAQLVRRIGIFLAVPSMEFPADRTAPSRARRFVSDTLRGWDIPRDKIADAVLLVSELVTNALLHARSAPSVELTHDGGRVRVDVVDESPTIPRRRRYASDAVTGRGIALVETLASRWGSEREGSGKRVWFELDVNGTRDDRNVSA
jgi:anti-sigma regulatory factor (Ser/Thr protein kinase)